MDPDRDGCGLLWCSPVAPANGRDARAVAELAMEIVLEHGFEPAISITMITERALACIISLGYDRDVPGEDERAMQCRHELLRRLGEAGYYSYRLNIGGMSSMDDGTEYQQLLHDLRSTLDPQGILAPGRYLTVRAKSHSTAV